MNEAPVPSAPAPESAGSTASAEAIRACLRQVIDPELQYNIVDLGLIYETRAESPTTARVIMTLTSPGCPFGPMIIHETKEAVKTLGFAEVNIDITWDPPWSPDRMSEEAKLDLGFDL
jgi:metal-sulfur cluster biosynthetic enzyme